MLVLELPIAEEQLAGLEAEGDFSYLVALPIDGDQKVVQIHIRRRKFYDAIYAAGRRENRHPLGVDAPPLEGARLVRRPPLERSAGPGVEAGQPSPSENR